MAPITPSEWVVLGLRLLFVALLYVAVLAIFLSLRRELRRGQQRGRPGARRLPGPPRPGAAAGPWPRPA